MVPSLGNPTPLRYANDSHQPRQQTLADGSVATLDAGTTLHARFGWRHRNLVLERGRVQLQVAPSSKALQLRAGDSTIRDIGTTFQVERLNDGLVEVALLEGAVEVSNGGTQRTLAPGQQLQVNCTWNNNTGNDIRFPREMCVGSSFYFPADNGEIGCSV